mmetsp:Transcript_8139/g.19406  ORF Transcript_8139/g.19406 Transcript_8139/m.19406 type:complete len:590 (-) Transcript_8139:14-1783(-)
MQEVQVLTGDQEVQHVVALAANLQTNLHPVQLRALEELRRGEDVHQVALVQRLGRAMVQLVENPDLQEFLVGHAHLHRVVRRTVLLVPLPNKRNILCTTHVAAAKVEGPWCPVERDAVRRAVREERSILKQRLAIFRQLEALDILVIIRRLVLGAVGHCAVRWQRIDDRIVVEGRKIGIIRFDVADGLVVVGCHRNLSRPRVVEERESDTVLGPQLLSHDNLVDVVELVPVLILIVHVTVKGLELGATWNCHIQRLCRVEGLLFEEVEVVLVHQIRQQLVGQAVQDALLSQGEMPLPVARAVHMLRVQKWHRFIKPLQNWLILDRIQPHLDGFQGLHIQDVVSIVQRRLLVVEGREAHSLEVASVSLLSAHHDPHGTPLSKVHGLDDLLHLRTEGDGTTAVVHGAAIADLLPRNRDVFEKLVHRMRQVLQSTQVDALVVTELPGRHISVILDDLSDMLRRHLLLLLLNNAKLALLSIPLRVQGLPLSCFLIKQLFLGLVRRGRLWRLWRWGLRRETHSSSRLCHLLLLRHPRHSWRQSEGVQGQAVAWHLAPHLALARKIEHGCTTRVVDKPSSVSLITTCLQSTPLDP